MVSQLGGFLSLGLGAVNTGGGGSNIGTVAHLVLGRCEKTEESLERSSFVIKTSLFFLYSFSSVAEIVCWLLHMN